MTAFTQSWNKDKNRRANLLSQQVYAWSKKPQHFLKDLENKDFDVLDWDVSYQNMPLWMYLFFSDHGPFKSQEFKKGNKSQNTYPSLFLKFCQTRDISKAKLPSQFSHTPWEIAQQGLGACFYSLSQNMMFAAINWSYEEANHPSLRALMELVDVFGQKSTTQFQGVVAQGLRQAVFLEDFPQDMKNWWKNQHSSTYYSFVHKTITALPEMLLSHHVLCPDGVFSPHMAGMIEELMSYRFEKHPQSPMLLLPSSLKMIDGFRKNKETKDNQTYQAFVEKVLLMDATKTWPFQQRQKTPKSKKM